MGAKELWECCGPRPDPGSLSKVPTWPASQEGPPLCSTLVPLSQEAASVGQSWDRQGGLCVLAGTAGKETKSFSEPRSLGLVTHHICTSWLHRPGWERGTNSTLTQGETREDRADVTAVP